MTRPPRIADVRCSRLKFEPGDRVLVRVHCDLSREETDKLRRSVERWAGRDVEVLIYDARKASIDVERQADRAASRIIVP